jgi:hypothetical protein
MFDSGEHMAFWYRTEGPDQYGASQTYDDGEGKKTVEERNDRCDRQEWLQANAQEWQHEEEG